MIQATLSWLAIAGLTVCMIFLLLAVYFFSRLLWTAPPRPVRHALLPFLVFIKDKGYPAHARYVDLYFNSMSAFFVALTVVVLIGQLK